MDHLEEHYPLAPDIKEAMARAAEAEVRMHPPLGPWSAARATTRLPPQPVSDQQPVFHHNPSCRPPLPCAVLRAQVKDEDAAPVVFNKRRSDKAGFRRKKPGGI